MATAYTPDSLRNLFQSSFNLAQWYSFLQHFFNATELKSTPERIIENTSDEGFYLGNIDTTDSELKSQCDVLIGYINEGIYAQLPRYLKALSREYKNDRAKMKQDEYSLQNKISELLGEYQTMNKEQRHDAQDISNPQIIISESFV